MIYPNEQISIGYTNAAIVSEIKIRLNKLGLSSLSPNIPLVGVETVTAIKKFQKSRGLIQDGIIGELTWNRLFEKSAPSASNQLSARAIYVAKGYLDVREKTNRNDGTIVERFLRMVGLGKGYAWCMAFIYTVFSEAAKTLNSSSPVPKTAGVLDCLRIVKEKNLGLIIKSDPMPGDQGIMDFGGGKGHTFIVTERKGNKIFTIEGNTSADPSYPKEDREGNGVFERSRLISTIKCFIRYY